MAHPDVPVEQAHLERSRTALAAMAVRTRRALDDVGAAATQFDSEVAAHHLHRRLASLEVGDGALAFGRIDEGAEQTHIGRRHVEDEEGDPLVVDWRAPVAVPFYRATVHEPLGLDRRRRFLVDGPRLIDILEEDFSDPDATSISGGVPDPLLAELDRERSGEMRDIVATIAAEQDEVIRTPLHTLLVVQGGPGTGKTAVALHRAAYLLFEHRLDLLDRGVLVVGPNDVFLSYVANVLPSLGETAVRQTTVGGLRSAQVRPDVVDDPAPAAALKGDRRMAAVIRAAIADRIRVPKEGVDLPTPWGRVSLTPDDIATAVDEVAARSATHVAGKESLRNLLLHRAYAVHERVAEVPALKANFQAEARRDPGFKAFIDRLWPSLSAPALVHRLLTSAAARRRATVGALSSEESDLLARPLPKKLSEVRWRVSEIPLIDEAEALINGVRRVYGLVIVDEAQDLSAMALRMLARRAPGGSMTVVGDLAQATTAWSQRSWDEVVDLLSGDVDHEVVYRELTVGYRTPAAMLDYANRLLPVAAPNVTPARSVRSTGIPPQSVLVAPRDVVGAVVRAVSTSESDADVTVGTSAVIAVAAIHAEIAAALDEAGTEWGRGAGGLGSTALLDPLLAKGLEFDHVVVVEPAAIVEHEPAGVRALFVALTRATQTLTIVHAEPMPALLRD